MTVPSTVEPARQARHVDLTGSVVDAFWSCPPAPAPAELDGTDCPDCTGTVEPVDVSTRPGRSAWVGVCMSCMTVLGAAAVYRTGPGRCEVTPR